LLVVGGPEIRAVESAVWLDPATGEPVRRREFYANKYAVSLDHRRLVLATGPWAALAPADYVRWQNPWADGDDWETLDLGGGRRATNSVVALVFTPDGGRLIVGHDRQPMAPSRRWTPGYHTTVFRFDPTRAETVDEVEELYPAVAVAPDGRFAGTGGIDGDPGVDLYTRPGGNDLAAQFDPPGAQTRQLVFAPDGSRLAAVNGRRVFQLSGDRLEPVADRLAHPKQANAVAYAPDGRRLLTACHDGAVRVWEVDGRPVRAYEWKVGPVTAVAVAPDGLTAAAAGSGGRVVVWDLDE
jgi:WD40 repeat protein